MLLSASGFQRFHGKHHTVTGFAGVCPRYGLALGDLVPIFEAADDVVIG